jgi:hypothetical protein
MDYFRNVFQAKTVRLHGDTVSSIRQRNCNTGNRCMLHIRVRKCFRIQGSCPFRAFLKCYGYKRVNRKMAWGPHDKDPESEEVQLKITIILLSFFRRALKC